MLVLARQRGEKCIIDCHGVLIEVSVVDIRGDKVRLAFSAPRDVTIHRQEVYEAIQRGNAKAAKAPSVAQ